MSSTRNFSKFLFAFIIILSLTLSLTKPEVAAASATTQGQDGITRQYSAETGKVNFISTESGRPMAASKVLDLKTGTHPADPAMAFALRFGTEFGLKNPARELTTAREDRSKDGRVTVHYQQAYKGIPVLAGELIVNTNEQGDLYAMNGEVSPDLSISTQPGIDAAEARQIALQGMAKGYQMTAADFIVSEPALWIYDPRLLGPDHVPAALVWRMEVRASDSASPINELILVDAQRGNISMHFNQIDTSWSGANVTSDVSRPPQQDEPTSTPVPTDAIEPMATPMPTNTPQPPATDELTVDPSTPTSQYLPLKEPGSPSAGSGPYYVDIVGGNDGNACTSIAAPCQHIQETINKAASGDTIYVAVGTYTGSGSQVVLINIDITLSGGWDAAFTTQSGMSTIDGQGARLGVTLSGGAIGVIDHFIVQDGSACDAGGIRVWGGGTTLTLNNSIISNNTKTCSGGGGGIDSDGNTTVNNSTISNNVGGGINSDSGTLTLNNSTISGNTLDGYGGGIDNDATAILNNSTVSGNTVNFNGGGGIHNHGTLTLNNSTISQNIANNSSGGGLLNDGLVTIQNTILAMNVATSGPDCAGTVFGTGTISSSGYNLIGNNSGCTFTATTGDLVGTSASPINARLTALQDNGGPTFTHALYSNSPALDAGNPALPASSTVACLATDQRGISLPVGFGCDIGAFEGSVPYVFNSHYSTYTTNNGTSLPGTFLCDASQPLCTNGVNPHADSAHAFAADTYDLYAVKHGRDSLDDNGMTIISTVHFDTGYDNAFWSGFQMVYGDAHNYPMADDVVAHELTHGVTQYESALFYYYQSGAINESFSDLWGEYFDQTNGTGTDTAAVKWLFGEDLTPGGTGAIRSMSNPPLAPFSDPDKMTSALYYKGDADSGGVHTNSGVNNKAVFLVVDGGTFNGKTVTAIGWDKTAAIYYEVNTRLLTSGADYADLYNTLYQGCLNLVGGSLGITSANCQQVRNATEAVEMNLQPQANFNSDAPLCGPLQPANTIFFDDLENGTSNWSFTNSSSFTRWQYDSPYGPFAHSGTHFLYADDFPEAVTNATARLIPVAIPAGAYLHFAHAYDFEHYTADPNHYDGGVLEYSTNAGGSWNDAGSLIDYNNYGGPIASGFGNPLAGRSAFVGTSHGYISTRLNLSSLAGQNVTFRWRMALDPGGFRWGWWLDDVRIYTCVQPTFVDVPFDHPFHDYIEALWDAGLTAGCSVNPLTYCPNTILDRAQAAVFMLRGEFGTGYVPPLPPWNTFADDWSLSDISYAQKWAEGMWQEGMTAGCQNNPVLLYCPRSQLPRVEASVFGLNMMHGVDYTLVNSPTTGTVFADMTDPGYYGTKWAEQAYLDGLLLSCGTQGGKPLFCPDDLVDRAWAAYLIVKAKDLVPTP